MRKLRLPFVALLITFLGALELTAQRVIAYHQGEKNDNIENWYWDYVTDVNYCFAQIHTNGTIQLYEQGADAFTAQNKIDNFNELKQKATNAGWGGKIHLSFGGASATQAANFKDNVANASLTDNLATNMVNFAIANGFSGIDIDWEPESDGHSDSPTAAEWTLLAQKLREKITASGQSLELSAAVFPFKWNNDYITSSCYTYFDHLNLMIYDFGGDFSHHSNQMTTYSGFVDPDVSFNWSGMNVEEAAVRYWNEDKGLGKDKMVLGLPFYGRSPNWAYSQNDYSLYRDVINAGGSPTADYHSGTNINYNGQTTIERKTTYAIDNGLKGVMFWEWAGDATTEANSLQATINNVIDVNGSCAKPDLGDAQNICGIENITLDAGIPSAGDYTYKWYNNNVLQSGTSSTIVASAPGSWRVEATLNDNSCTRSALVQIEGTYDALPALNDVSLCGDASDVDATIAGFEHMDYSWTKDGGAQVSNTPVVSISDAGTYTITVSDPYGHCADQTDDVIAAAVTVDVTVDPVCDIGYEAYYVINNPSGTYKWYTAATGGTDITANEDHHLYRNYDGNPIYVTKLGGATDYTVGLNYDHTAPSAEGLGPAGCTSFGPGGDYECAWNGSGCDLNDTRLYFTTHQEVTITSFYTRLDHTGDADVVIYDGDGNVAFTETVNIQFAGEQEVVVNFTIPAGNWYLGMPDAANWVESKCNGDATGWVPESTYDYSTYGLDGVIDFNTTVASSAGSYGQAIDHWYAGFYDIKISTGKACPRVEVEPTVDAAVCPQNDAPTLTFTATPNSNVIEGDVVVLEWSATDPEGDDLTITITEGGATRSWNSPYSWTATTGSTTFEVTVSDGTNDDVVETITIDVAANQSPVVNLASDVTSGITGDDVTFTWSATDPEGESLDVKIFLNGQEQSWTSPYTWTSTTGDHLIRVEAEDPRGGVSSQEISVTITDPANESPSVDGISVNPDPADVGEDVSISVSASDNDGTVASIDISVDGQDLVGPNATWTPTSDGDFTINVTVTDDDGATASDSYVITVNAVAVNQDPVINSVTASPNPAETGQTVSIVIDAADNDGSIASIETTVDNQTFSGSNVSFTPSSAGTYSVSVTVTDNQGATDTYSTTVLVNDPSTGGTGTDGGCDDFEEAEGNGVYFAANESVFATSRANGVYEVTVTHGSESIWAPVFANFADENGNDQSIDVSGNPTGSVVVSNPSSEVVEVYFTIRDGSGAKATADISSGSANVWGGRMGPGESMTVNFDLTQARTRSWSDGTGCAGDFVAPNHCMVNEGLDLTDITNVEWSINKGLDASPWNEALDGVTVTFDDFVFGVCPNDVVDPGNQDPVIASIDVNPNPAEVDENVSINVVASDADGSIASYSISVDGQVFNSSSATWSTSTAGTYTINVTVTDNEGATATSSASVTVEDPGNNNGGGTDMVTILTPAQGEDIENPGIITVEIEADAAVENVYVLVTYPDGSSQYKPAYDADGDGVYNFIIVPDANTGIGSYSMEVIARDGNGGEDRETLDFTTSGAVDFSGPGTGIATSTVFSGVVVYPMPAVEFVNVELSTYSNGSGTVEILDMNGNVRYETEVTTSGASATTLQMPVENLNTGIYFIRLTVDGDTIVEKLIVE